MPGRALIVAVVALLASALLSACANPAARTEQARGASDQPSPDRFDGRAVGLADPLCRLATDTAVPAPKRSLIAEDCSRRRSSGIAPVTKPTPSAALSTPTHSTIAPTCIQRSLSARFLGAGYESGNDFGMIVIWNPDAAPCQLGGTERFAGYDTDGSRDMNAISNRPGVARAVALPARMSAPRDGKFNAGTYLIAYLQGTERDDSAQPNGLCRPSDEGTPATFVLGIGSLTFTVRNADPQAMQVHAVYGCHGRVLFEGVEGPQSD